MNHALIELLARNWWLMLLKGLAAIAFGLLAFVWPGITLLSLVILYGAYTAVDGVLSLIAAFGGGPGTRRGWLIFLGLLGLAVAALTFFYPGLTAFILLMFIGAWAIVRGVTEIIGAIQLRKEIESEWLLILSGVLSVLFGLFVILSPGRGALALIWFIATYAIIVGILLVSFSFWLRRFRHAVV